MLPPERACSIDIRRWANSSFSGASSLSLESFDIRRRIFTSSSSRKVNIRNKTMIQKRNLNNSSLYLIHSGVYEIPVFSVDSILVETRPEFGKDICGISGSSIFKVIPGSLFTDLLLRLMAESNSLAKIELAFEERYILSTLGLSNFGLSWTRYLNLLRQIYPAVIRMNIIPRAHKLNPMTKITVGLKPAARIG